jgi:hypothetical protein
MPLILLRAFQDTRDEQVARALALRASDVLRAAGYSVSASAVRPYWKIPEYFEIRIEISQSEQTGIDHAIDKLGSGWLRPRPTEAIWNAGPKASFIDELVRWVHLELIE